MSVLVRRCVVPAAVLLQPSQTLHFVQIHTPSDAFERPVAFLVVPLPPELFIYLKTLSNDENKITINDGALPVSNDWGGQDLG